MQIYGLAGTINAGKDVVGNLLAEKYGFLHMSTSDMLREIKRREFGDSPQALLIRNDPFVTNLRDTKGPGFLVDAVHQEWLANKDKYPGGLVASAIRAIGEVERIHELGGKLIFVDADPKIRYERSQRRQRDANEAGKSFEEFIEIENREVNVDPDDKSVTNMPAMRQMADTIIQNNSDDIEAFKAQAIKALNL